MSFFLFIRAEITASGLDSPKVVDPARGLKSYVDVAPAPGLNFSNAVVPAKASGSAEVHFPALSLTPHDAEVPAPGLNFTDAVVPAGTPDSPVFITRFSSSQSAPGFRNAQQEPLIVHGTLSVEEALPNEEFTLTLSLEEAADLFFIGMEVVFDPGQIEFLELQNTGITGDGLKVNGETGRGRVGVAVSRTETEEVHKNGPFMDLTLRVKATAAAESSEIVFQKLQMTDSAGDPVDVAVSGPVVLDVGEGIGVAELLLPEQLQIVEGETVPLEGRVYASGVTDEENGEERLEAWIGVHHEDTDPSTWSDSSWTEMEFSGREESYFYYDGQVEHLGTGFHYAAMKSRLDGGEPHFGGVNGTWDEQESPSAVLEVGPLPGFRFAAAFWDFSDERLTPSASIPANDSTELQISGAGLRGGSVETQATGGVTYLNTVNWHEEEEVAEKYLSIVVSTHKLEELELSSSHSGSNTGPAVFQVQLSKDGSQWADLAEGGIDLREENPVHLAGLEIPDEYEQQDSLHIRWLKTEDHRLDGSDSGVWSSGVHRVGNIRISGLHVDPGRLDVMPGDANNDGIVNAADVLALGMNWLRSGPEAIHPFIDFAPREVERWIPEEATYADTDGDGTVDQADLLPVGLNFGKSVSSKNIPGPDEWIAHTQLPRLEEGDELEVIIEFPRPEKIKGLACRLSIEGIPEEAWTLFDIRRPAWADAWDDEGALLDLHRRDGRAIEEAYTVAGRAAPVEIQDMNVVRLRAEKTWEFYPELNLEWLVLRREGGIAEPYGSVELNIHRENGEEPDDNLPSETALKPNAPNPFRGQTDIVYTLHREKEVKLQVFNAAGRFISTLVDKRQEPGLYKVHFNPRGLASGIYFYRLLAGSRSHTGSMVLIR